MFAYGNLYTRHNEGVRTHNTREPLMNKFGGRIYV